MRLRRLRAAFELTARELASRRVVLLMLILVPSVCYAVILLVAGSEPIWFQLGAIEAEDYLRAPERAEALVFAGLAAVGVVTSFLAMNLLQRDREAARRLVLCGYRPWELMVARLAVLLIAIVVVSCCVAAILPFFFTPQRLPFVVLGFALCGWVYACYGLLVGALLKQELEGVLLVVLLANIDIGWLQNPIYYAHAQRQAVIRALPGFLPSQVSMAAAFSEHTAAALLRLALLAALYGAAFLVAALTVWALRMRGMARPSASASLDGPASAQSE